MKGALEKASHSRSDVGISTTIRALDSTSKVAKTNSITTRNEKISEGPIETPNIT